MIEDPLELIQSFIIVLKRVGMRYLKLFSY